MDPFVFDQRFARYVSGVNSSAISRGTELYEAGGARLHRVSGDRIQGSVEEGKRGVFQVTLSPNEEGGLSGSCNCEEIFNCCHSYALARAARDQVMAQAGLGRVGNSKPSNQSKDTNPFAARLGRKLDREEAECAKEIERLFRLAMQSGWLVYPRDLYGLRQNRDRWPTGEREPIRELKRLLQESAPKDELRFGDVLLGFLVKKGIPLREGFAGICQKPNDAEQSAKVSKSGGGLKWDRPPLELSVRIQLEETGDDGWLRMSARYEVKGGGFSESELDRLVKAKGELVNLGEKGWHRLKTSLGEGEESLLAAMGIDPWRGNQQRVHASQVEEMIPEALLDESSAALSRQAISDLNAMPEPALPPEMKGVLRSYQETGFRFLARLSQWGLGGILADDMGLGKTVQTLSWLLWLSGQSEDKTQFRALIVCPKSVVENWVREPAKFQVGLSAARFESGRSGGFQTNLVVANYAQLRLNQERFVAENWDAVVLDEGQYIKSPSSQTTKAACSLKAAHRIVLSGTPIENSLMDLWSIMRFAMPRLLGPQAAFRANYDLNRSKDALGALKKRIQPFMLRRLKREVAKDLPERIEESYLIDLEGEQRMRYDAELEAARERVSELQSEDDWRAERFSVLQILLRLRQICCDPRLLGEDSSEYKESAKVQALLDLVEPILAEGHKVLVFSQFVSMLEVVEAALREEGVEPLVLTGKTKDRQGLVDRFQDSEKAEVFLLSLKAAGSGLNLTAASYVVLLDPWWNPAVEAQAIDRAHRIGQTNTVIAYRFIARNTIEEKIVAIQNSKASLASAVIGDEGIDAAMSLDALRELIG